MHKITEGMTIEDVLDKYPQTVGVFTELQIPCLVCGEPLWDTIKEASERYNVELSILLKRLNEIIEKKQR